jgi:hypothetical protein
VCATSVFNGLRADAWVRIRLDGYSIRGKGRALIADRRFKQAVSHCARASVQNSHPGGRNLRGWTDDAGILVGFEDAEDANNEA